MVCRVHLWYILCICRMFGIWFCDNTGLTHATNPDLIFRRKNLFWLHAYMEPLKILGVRLYCLIAAMATFFLTGKLRNIERDRTKLKSPLIFYLS